MKAYQRILTATLAMGMAFTANIRAGDLDPPGPPGSTMKSLQEIWDKLEALSGEIESLREQNLLLHRYLQTVAEYQGLSRDWVFKIIDGSAASVWGLYSDLVIAPDGYPAIACKDSTDDNLVYAKYSGSSWIKITFNTTNDLGTNASLAFKPDGNPVIACVDETDSNIIIANYDKGSWSLSNVTNTGRCGTTCDMCLLSNGDPLIFFEDEAIGLRVAVPDESIVGGWDFYTILDTTDHIGHISACNPPVGTSRPAFAFIKSSIYSSSLSYGELIFKNGSIIGDDTSEVKSGLGSGNTYRCDLKRDTLGNPTIAFGYFTLEFLRYDGSDWVTEVVDDSDMVGKYCSLAYNTLGNPGISYYDQANNVLKLALFDGVEWQLETVDPDSITGTHTSLAFVEGLIPAISYHAKNLYLTYAELRADRLIIPPVSP
jgi:hypothetical protein